MPSSGLPGAVQGASLWHITFHTLTPPAPHLPLSCQLAPPPIQAHPPTCPRSPHDPPRAAADLLRLRLPRLLFTPQGMKNPLDGVRVGQLAGSGSGAYQYFLKVCIISFEMQCSLVIILFYPGVWIWIWVGGCVERVCVVGWGGAGCFRQGRRQRAAGRRVLALPARPPTFTYSPRRLPASHLLALRPPLLQVVPTTYTSLRNESIATNQFSVTEHFK